MLLQNHSARTTATSLLTPEGTVTGERSSATCDNRTTTGNVRPNRWTEYSNAVRPAGLQCGCRVGSSLPRSDRRSS